MKHSLILFSLLFISFSGISQIPGWNHSQPITILEHSGNLVTNYQIKLTIDTQTPISTGDMLANGDDIRFSTECNGGDLLNYWIESDINTAATQIWVKVDSIPANGGKTIYLNYGNASAPSISAINGTFIGPQSCTDSVSGGATGGVTNSQRGIRFAANEDLLVTAFGKNEPNGSIRYITLFDVTTQAILRQMQVSGPAAQYSYQDLSSPIWLTQDTQYVLEMYQDNTDGYYFGPSTSQIGQHFTYLDMRYCNGCDQNTYPGNYLNNIHYGYPDFWYYSKNNVDPAPTYQLGSFITNMADDYFICMGDSAILPLTILGGQAPFDIQWTGTEISSDTILQPIAFPSDTLEYHVAITDLCGFTNTDSITFNVGALPVANLQATATIVCNGEWSELTVDTLYSAVWDDNSTADSLVVSPSVTTTYHVQTTDNNGCQSYDSIQIVFHTPAYLTRTVHKCFGESYQVGTHIYTLNGTYIDTLSGVSNCDSIITTELTFQDDIDSQIQQIGLTLVADLGADGYQWVDCTNGNTPIPGATDSYYEATQNGSYAVISSLGSCSKQSSCIDITTVGLEEFDQIDNLSVFPNPTTGNLTIQSSVSQELKIVDIIGNVVRKEQVVAGISKQIDLSILGTGSYYLQSRTKVIRFVIQ
ncbi:DUF2341 domain-containing protein [Fluviicola chungangensis]|uniref:DUF2341 domain-containing protein n=1 Tax=Fluviicola chungangensis TaxID=2597671 RepID=A0A556N2X3_9FLAO|nr:DUF2341 domain-containing protein [Fluviicola chungangensis]TSJ46399.1 DUF2341 domain-containing protein [Fluviicola chungangensis]